MSKVLIVEDNIDLARMYQRLFTFKKFEAILAYDGKQGIDQVTAYKPDIILLDIMLPAMSGVDVLKALKNDPTTASIPVIMLTNVDQDEVLQECLKLGAVSYMVKSNFTPNEVIEEVSKHLPEKTPAA